MAEQGSLLAGILRGLSADTVGAPVDLATAVANLGIAGGGYAAHKLGLIKQPPDLIQNPVGGSDWFAKGTPLEDDGSNRYQAGRLGANVGAVAMTGPRVPVRHGQVNMFIGPQAKTWNADKAMIADGMENSGKSPEYIWEKTGTMRGPDGFWRQEISDEGSRVPSPFGPNTVSTIEGTRASKYLEHPDLYSAYPELADRRVRAQRGAGGSLDSKGRVNIGVLSDQKSVGLHEMQHAIQDVEGWGRGGSPTEFGPAAEQFALQRGYGESSATDMNRAKRVFSNTLYNSLAGETEARLTQARRMFNDEERAANFPPRMYSVPKDQQLVLDRYEMGPEMLPDLLRRLNKTFKP